MTTAVALACDNDGEAGRRANVPRPLTRSLDLGKEGLMVQPTVHYCSCGRNFRRGAGWAAHRRAVVLASGSASCVEVDESLWRQLRKHPRRGSFAPILDDDELARFWSQVEKTDTCWLWRGPTNSGYGRFCVRAMGWHNGPVGAHRISWYLSSGQPIDAGLHLDHLCRNPICVRPDHLEPVTSRTNTLRGETIPAANAAKTHCPRGHAYDSIRRRGNGTTYRACKRCAADAARRRYYAARLARGETNG